MDAALLNTLAGKIKEILLGEVKDIILTARNGKIIAAEEKGNGDSATAADLQIGALFSEKLPELLPGSVVINEEDFSEEVFRKMQTAEYIWVVDPIDGTKAFRTPGNTEYCCGVGLLQSMRPVLSLVLLPEYEFGDEKGLLFEASEAADGAFLNGKPLAARNKNDISTLLCINHIHRDTQRSESEERISSRCKDRMCIRAYEGHSTLANYALTAADGMNRIFTRRNANLWDVEQSAYIVVKAGGAVFYNDGADMFPLAPERLHFRTDENGNAFLVIDANIACASSLKETVLKLIRG